MTQQISTAVSIINGEPYAILTICIKVSDLFKDQTNGETRIKPLRLRNKGVGRRKENANSKLIGSVQRTTDRNDDTKRSENSKIQGQE